MDGTHIQELTNEEIVLAGLGNMGRANPMMKNMRQSAKQEIGASLFRRHMLERLHMLPKEIQNALLKGSAQVADSPYYAVAQISGTRAELIKTSQPESTGITNIDNGKLGKDRWLVLSGMKLLYDANTILGTFTNPYPAALLNGEWELELNGKTVFEKQPVRDFHDGIFGYDIHKPFGVYILDNPKIVPPQTPIEFNVDSSSNLSGFLHVRLLGTVVKTY